MNITKFAFLLVGLVSASSAVEYRLRDTPDPSIIASDYGSSSDKFDNGIVGKNERDIKLLFGIFRDETIDHLYNLTIGSKKGKLAFEEGQYEIFMDALNQSLNHLQQERDRAYKHAKGTEEALLAESGKMFFKDKAKIQELEPRLRSELEELKSVDKKLLKLRAFSDYCSLEGCLFKKTKSFTDEISELFGSNKENKNNANENNNVFNFFNRKAVRT